MRLQRTDRTSRGFTLIELLVVIGIIAVLAGLLLPAFGGALSRGKETKCMSNMRQIGVMTMLYADENGDRFPVSGVREFTPIKNAVLRKPTLFALGGKNPKPGHATIHFLQATNRPLYQYQGNENVFHCPMDKGHRARPHGIDCPPYHEISKPSLWDYAGSSYMYNSALYAPVDNSRVPPLPPVVKTLPRPGLPRITTDEVEYPDRFILAHEPPARPVGRTIAPFTVEPWWCQWHRNRGRVDFRDPTIAPDLFFSNTLYVDGRVEMNNFSKSVKTDPYYPYEETLKWIWYQPRN